MMGRAMPFRQNEKKGVITDRITLSVDRSTRGKPYSAR